MLSKNSIDKLLITAEVELEKIELFFDNNQ